MHTTGNRLRALRLSHGLKHHEVSALIGKDQSLVSRYEKGEINPPDETKLVLAKRYGVTVEYLMGWDRDENLEPAA